MTLQCSETHRASALLLNINTVNRLIILQKKALQITNFKVQIFHSSPFFSENNFLKFGDAITIENILFVNKLICRQVPTPCFMISLYFLEICIDIKLAGLLIIVLTYQLLEPKSMVALVQELVLYIHGTLHKISQ